MADVKISALPAASTPLTGGEVLPIVQSSTTKQVAVSNLTAGLAGTASININGTVGATTATTGAFTSGTFSTTLGVTGTSTLGNFNPGNNQAWTSIATTGYIYADFVNTSGRFGLVVEGSTANTAIPGSLAYASAVGSLVNKEFYLLQNNAISLKIEVGGAVTIPGTLGVTGELSVIKNSTTQIFYVDNINASPYIAQWRMTGTAPNNTTNSFLSCLDNTTTCFTIWSNGTTSGRSDSKLKKNIAPVNNQLEDVMAMEVVNYEWNKSIGGTKEVGFIAQQVQGVKPGLVCADEKGFLHIKQTPLTPILWKAVQELAVKVAALEAK